MKRKLTIAVVVLVAVFIPTFLLQTALGECVKGAPVKTERYEGEMCVEIETGKIKRDGHGIYTWPDGTRYEGEWRNDKKEGRGTYTWSDGTRYEGEWLDDKKDGRGTLTRENGERYKGEWRDDKKEGRGTFTWPDGVHYEGEWLDDEKDGRGILTYKGKWRNGEYIGKSKMVKKSP